MKELTIVILNNSDDVRQDLIEEESIDICISTEEDLEETIKNTTSKYIMFINNNDEISNVFYEKIKKKIKDEFDCCFINYDFIIENKTNNKILKNRAILKNYKPYYKEYIWSFIYRKDILEKILGINNEQIFNSNVDKLFINTDAIGEPIIFHNPYKEIILNNFIYSDIKKIKEVNNLFYIEKGCRGIFNGYISMIKNYGRCYKDKFEIAILYDEINPITKKDFEQYFECWENRIDTLFISDKLFVMYTSYFYPKNIISLSNNYLLIEGNMCDYKNSARYNDDIYTNYLAASKTTAYKAKGYYPTENIECVLNPYKLDFNSVMPRMKLVSTFRYSNVKHPERIEKMARIIESLRIPYTWEVFTDKRENTNENGLIFRKRTPNPLPYVADCDYFVLLSDSEAFCYSVIEALSLQTKVVVTPLPVFEELGILDKYNTTVIPFEYFDEGNESKLTEIVINMYRNKNTKIKYEVDEGLTNGYDNIFT